MIFILSKPSKPADTLNLLDTSRVAFSLNNSVFAGSNKNPVWPSTGVSTGVFGQVERKNSVPESAYYTTRIQVCLGQTCIEPFKSGALNPEVTAVYGG
jgi:hypothetical protein